MKRTLITIGLFICAVTILRAGISTGVYAANLYTKQKHEDATLERINTRIKAVPDIDVLRTKN